MSTNKTHDGYMPSCMTNGWYEMRIAELESLVMDMYGSLWTVSEPWAYDSYHERMADLGLLEGDA